jgi:hypothetical protein
MNIDVLKSLLKDDRLHVGLGLIKNLHLAQDRSYLKVTLSVLPEERQIIATMTWDNTGPSSGDFEFPSINDLVLFAQAEGDNDQAYVIRRLTSREDRIPEEAVNGDKVSRAKLGKKYWNVSNTRINLSRSGTEPTQNLVLGQVFKTAYSTHLGQIATALTEILAYITEFKAHTHAVVGIGDPINQVPTLSYDLTLSNAGVSAIESAINGVKSALEGIKASPVDDSAMLSDLVFTQK